jgi:outer membrane protein assembly factor BamD
MTLLPLSVVVVEAEKRRIFSVGRRAVLLLTLLPIAGCSSLQSFDPFGLFGNTKYVTKIDPQVPVETMYNQGLARLYAHDFSGAAKQFDNIDKQYPFTQFSRKALMMETYSQYQNGDYDDAIGSATRYVTLYPNEDDTDYAYYLEAMSNYNSIPDVSRDQERAQKALDLFTQIVQKYPKSEYVDDAKYKIQVTKDQLAGKEMSVGRFYLDQRDYPAAINRFHTVLAKYQTTRETEEALYRLTEAYLAMGIVNEAETAAAVLGHNFPDSSWYKSAYALLKGKGLQPDENTSSWISKVFKGIVG